MDIVLTPTQLKLAHIVVHFWDIYSVYEHCMKLITCIWTNKNQKCHIKIYSDYSLNTEEDKCVPKPHRPSGIAFSWIGDGRWNPAFWRPLNILSDRSSPEKLTFSFIKTSPVLDFPCMSWATDVFDMLTKTRLWTYHKSTFTFFGKCAWNTNFDWFASES